MRIEIILSILLFTSGTAQALQEKRVSVMTTARRPCWTYHGDATVFSGTFAANQHVTVHMRGEVYEGNDDDHLKVIVADRSPNVDGPNGFTLEADNGPDLAFVTPRAGIYEFTFSPNVMLGNSGDVEICAR